ncbi:MAG TPA: tyrosine-type recombinase/integrase, partial [Gaiellaceae bacterium]|nr:tyrosine-type recombinase/integrase [Gaiellaceae bacterium]
DALAEYSELRGKVAKGEKVAPSKLRFRDVAEEWWASDESPKATSTRLLYRGALDNELLDYLGHRRLAEIDLDVILGLLSKWKARGLSKKTCENYLGPVRGVFTYAGRRGLVTSNPLTLLRPSDFPEASAGKAYEWTQEEIDALLDASRYFARQPEARADYSPILTFAVYTGLRLGEILGLNWGDVDLGEKPVVTVRQQFTKYGEITDPKTGAGKNRRVPLWPEAEAVLRDLRKKAFAAGRASADDPVFTSRNGSRLQHRNVQRRGFERARDHAELLEHLTFHDLRHGFASLAADRGISVTFLSSVIGHANVSTTQKTYIHLFDREAHEDAFRQAGQAVGQ